MQVPSVALLNAEIYPPLISHNLISYRLCILGMLVVDGKEYRIQIAGRFIGLDLAQDLYIGGMPDFRLISKEAKYNRGFKGLCETPIIVDVHLVLFRTCSYDAVNLLDRILCE